MSRCVRTLEHQIPNKSRNRDADRGNVPRVHLNKINANPEKKKHLRQKNAFFFFFGLFVTLGCFVARAVSAEPQNVACSTTTHMSLRSSRRLVRSETPQYRRIQKELLFATEGALSQVAERKDAEGLIGFLTERRIFFFSFIDGPGKVAPPCFCGSVAGVPFIPATSSSVAGLQRRRPGGGFFFFFSLSVGKKIYPGDRAVSIMPSWLRLEWQECTASCRQKVSIFLIANEWKKVKTPDFGLFAAPGGSCWSKRSRFTCSFQCAAPI